MFENFPYTNLHELNLDWLIKELNFIKESAVISVNGMTGEVTLYTESDIVLPSVLEDHWSVVRTADGHTRGIMLGNDSKLYVVHNNRMSEVYATNNEPPYPVTSVNGETGDVEVFGGRNVNLPAVTGSDYDHWHITKSVNDIVTGIRFDNDGTAYILKDGTRYVLYTPQTLPNIVNSVNGQTGTVALFTDSTGNIQFPAVTDLDGWSTGRMVDGTNIGIGFTKTGNAYLKVGSAVYNLYTVNNPPPDLVDDRTTATLQITEDSPSNYWAMMRDTTAGKQGLVFDESDPSSPKVYMAYTIGQGQEQRVQLLTLADIPSSTGVVSINGQDGVVTLYSTDIHVSSTDNRSVSTALEDIKTTIAVVENTDEAQHNISAGTYVIWHNALYTARSAIVPGDTLSSTNLTISTPVMDIVKSLADRFNIVPTFHYLGTISTNSHASINITSTAGDTNVVLFGYSTNMPGIWMVHSSDANANHIKQVWKGSVSSDFTLNESGTTVSITTSSTSTTEIYALAMNGDVTASYA